MAASTAPPSSLFGTCWVFPFEGKCAAGSSHWTLLLPASLSICAFESGHRFLYNLGARSSVLSIAPRSRFCLTTVAVSLPTLYTITPTTQGVSIRSFQSSGTDRPSRTICNSQSADSQLSCVRFLLIYPATNTLERRLARLRNQNVAGVLTGRSLARSPPAVAGMAAGLSDNLQSLALALRFHLQASSKRMHAYTTRSHRTPPVGVQSQGTHNQQFTRPDAGNRTLACKNYHRTIQVRTTFDHNQQRLI